MFSHPLPPLKFYAREADGFVRHYPGMRRPGSFRFFQTGGYTEELTYYKLMAIPFFMAYKSCIVYLSSIVNAHTKAAAPEGSGRLTISLPMGYSTCGIADDRNAVRIQAVVSSHFLGGS